MGLNSLLWHADAAVTGFFSQWNGYSTALVGLLVGVATLMACTRRDADTHPLLLARQAEGFAVRHEGESPVYRSRSAPHSMPLHAGLDVRDPGTAKWARGRDGDLRDIWRKAAGDTPPAESPPRLLAVYGADVVATPLADVSRQICLIGQHLLDQGGNRVAIYLPNSVELLASLFACSFYNMTAVLLPFDQPDDVLVAMLRRAAVDTVITAPGCFPFDVVVQRYPALRQLVWVVDEGSKHLDWNELPQGAASTAVSVATWQEVVADAPADAGRELPPLAGQAAPRDITVFWEAASPASAASAASAAAPPEMVRLTSANLVAAVAAQLFAVPTAQRLGPADLFLVADSLSHSHTLVLTLAALYSNASVALSSAAPAAADLAAATRSVAPTVLVATPAALLRTHADAAARVAAAPLARLLVRWQTSTLADTGAFPAPTDLVSRLLDRLRPVTSVRPGSLRLIYTAERAGAGTPALSAAVLSDLRVLTGARVIYALAAAKVAGAAAQTAFYDYRVAPGTYAPFGPPLTCTEYLVRDKGEHQVTDDQRVGEIVIRGPSVAGGEAALGVLGVIRDDNSLAYA